jgi:YD repeat-containing protein
MEIKNYDEQGTHEYNEQGLEIRFEDEFGCWWTREYNDDGNEVRFDNSDGEWRTTKYNDRGQVVEMIDSDGYWEKIKYDAQGNDIMYENSKGYKKEKQRCNHVVGILVDDLGIHEITTDRNGVVKDEMDIKFKYCSLCGAKLI